MPPLTTCRRFSCITAWNINALSAKGTPAFCSRKNSNIASQESVNSGEGWLFVDSVFPVQLGRLDIRRYIGICREETLLSRLKAHLSTIKTHNFEILSLEPHYKDGGVFVKFKYNAKDQESALVAIEHDLRQHNGLPSWAGLSGGNIWLVKGRPWREDMNRFAFPMVKAIFESPHVNEEMLYQIFRPYGRIQDITAPAPVPASTLRSSVVSFDRLSSATIARNVVHGMDISANDQPAARLRTAYQKPIEAHVIRDWISGHPRIVLPILVFLLGTLTYTIFDPIRALMVQGKISEWFNYRESALYKWKFVNFFGKFSLVTPTSDGDDHSAEDVWKERKDAENALKSYLSDMPTTVTFMHGPQGSGKSRMLETLLKGSDRRVLIVDCHELYKAPSESHLVAGLANQTGFWPVFSFMNSINNMIDLASVGLIGQKAGLSSSLPEQLQKITDVVNKGLKAVSSSHRSAMKRKLERQRRVEEQDKADAARHEQIRQGIWHDGRLDCVAGNGVMSELGFGIEKMSDADKEMESDGDAMRTSQREYEQEEKTRETRRKERSEEDIQAIASLPIVVIKNYAVKSGARSPHQQDVLTVLGQWAATIVENQIAHVIVLSDNRENAKTLARALPSKPINFVALYDADVNSALSFVKKKLLDSGVDLEYTKEQIHHLERLGGRASDLESLIHKVRGGQKVEEAVEDIINRCVSELRKNAFGDDIEDAKHLQWSREQAWAIMKQLSKREEIPYYDVLSDFPFKGDESPLRNMDHAELISVVTNNGRPSSIRPGKPVYKYAFQRLVEDPIFRASQDIASNDKIIASAESTIKSCEQELATLKEIGMDRSWWGGKTGSSARAAYLFDKVLAAVSKVEALEKQNSELKKTLSKGDA